MKVVIFGSRGLQDRAALDEAMEMARILYGIEPTMIMHGNEQTGIDMVGDQWAEDRLLPIERYTADWLRYPKTGGMIRNVHMALRADAGVGVMIRGGSPGSKHMQKQLESRKLPCYVVEVDAPASVTGRAAPRR